MQTFVQLKMSRLHYHEHTDSNSTVISSIVKTGKRDSFNRYVKKTYCYENIAFLAEESKFHKLKYQFHINRIAKIIYKKFIKEGSENEINISSSVRNEIKNSINNGKINLKIFENAKKEIGKLVKTDSLRNFNNRKK